MTNGTALSGIEANTHWIRHYVDRMSLYIGMVTARRTYLTKAEDQLEKLEGDLVELLGKVRQARADFASKPVSDKAA